MVMLKYLSVFICCVCFEQGICQNLSGETLVSLEEMESVYEQIKTPFKYGMVMIHEDTSSMIDCATIFRKDSIWYMTYLVFEGLGYETWLAKSVDLLNWETLGVVLPYTSKGSKSWNQSAGYPALVDSKWGGSYALKQFDNKYWMSYFGSTTRGYERGKLSIGMAFTETDATIPHAWQRLDEPIMTTEDDDAEVWESDKLYKSSILWDSTKTAGSPFVMFYNAVGDTSTFERWVERIGVATSDDMIHWKRFSGNPIINHDVGLTGDAVVQKIDNTYVMFYYGAFWPKGRKEAFNRFACSYDLLNWTDWEGIDLIAPSESYDIKYAHKPCVIMWDDVVYHFYTAVNKKEQRGLAVATSKDLGQSQLNFKKVDIKLRR
ncbi:MAG: putative GH43/DUF377 family glycosyl hydrolase [bacterium]|jgi:predicted GH43/DUF377 family glycosyl hydrolase